MRKRCNKDISKDFYFLSPDPMAVVDNEGRIIKANPAFARILGKQEQDIRTIPFCSFFPETERDRMAITFKEARLTGKSITFDPPPADPAGKGGWIQWSIVPFLEKELFYISGRDISLLKQREQQLRISYAAMESAASGITLTNREGIIIWVNPAFLRISGLSRKDIVGEKPKIMSSGYHDREFFASLLDTIYSGLVWSGEIVNRRPDGTLYTVEETIAPIYNTGGEISHFVSVLQDITKRKEAERVIREHSELLQREISLAAEVQASLLPSSLPTLDGYTIASLAIPATYVSGDLYDYFPTGHERCFFAVADISGKGVPAAMLASSMKTLLRSFPESCDDPAAMLGRMNGFMFNELRNAGLFITVFAVSLDISLGTLRYAAAGHPQGIVIRNRDSSCELLPPTGIPLGIEENVVYTDGIACVGPGDLLILYSDGIIEAHNERNELFGLQRFLEVLIEFGGRPADEVAKKVIEKISAFRGNTPLSDDISLIILKGTDRTIPFSFQADLGKLEGMNNLVRSACEPYGEEFAHAMELIASELYTNVIRHSYRDSGGKIRGTLSLAPGEVTLDIYDTAAPFDFEDLPELDDSLPREGSYGLLIVKKLCDRLEYTPGGPDGNHWHAVKRREQCCR